MTLATFLLVWAALSVVFAIAFVVVTLVERRERVRLDERLAPHVPTSLISWCPCGAVGAHTDANGHIPFLISVEHRDCGRVAPVPASPEVRTWVAPSRSRQGRP